MLIVQILKLHYDFTAHWAPFSHAFLSVICTCWDVDTTEDRSVLRV